MAVMPNYELQRHCEVVGEAYKDTHRVAAVFLYGSQNYNMGTDNSDVDTKVMLIPRKREWLLGNRHVSAEVHVPNEQDDGFAIASAKDLRSLFAAFLTANLNFTEILFSQYCFTPDPDFTKFVWELRDHADLIANTTPRGTVERCLGMAREKGKEMSRRFAGKAAVLAQYGYDPKQLVHLVRLRYFAEKYVETQNFAACLVPDDEKLAYLMSLKLNPVPLAEAQSLRDKHLADLKVLADKAHVEFPEEYRMEEAREFLNDLVVRIGTLVCGQPD